MIARLKSTLQTPAAELGSGVRWWLLAGLAVYVLAGTLIMDRWQHRSGQSVRELGFGYGVLIRAIEETGEYRVPAGVHHPEVSFSAHRLPFIPYFLLSLKDALGDDLRQIGLVKCLLFGGLLITAVATVLRTARAPLWGVLVLLGVGLTMPRWVLNVFELSLEEGYNIVVLALLFALLWFEGSTGRVRVRWTLAVGAMLVLLLFLKSSMVYWCMAVPALAGLKKRSWTDALVLFVMVGAGLYGLAAFNERHSGRFTIGSSWEGWNLYKGNCAETATTYPVYSLDLLDYEGKVVADRPLTDEWDYNAYFKQRALEFIRAHPAQFVGNAVRKAWVFYGEVRASGLQQRGESRSARPEYLLQIPWMLAFRVMFWAAILLAVRTVWRWRREAWHSEGFVVALTYLVFLALYSAFHVIGFAYERHVMPVVMPTALYLIWRWSDNSRQAVTS